MIYTLNGTLSEILPSGAVVDAGGVGYAVEMPLTCLSSLPQPGQQVKVWVYTHVREDCLRLYGFSTAKDRNVFEVLLSLNGVGPKLALAILSALPLAAMIQAVRLERSEIFEAVPGVGKRLSERLLVDLKAKIKKLDVQENLAGIRSYASSTVAGNSSKLVAGSAPSGATLEMDDHKLAVLDDVRSALENLGFKDKLVREICIQLMRNQQQHQGDFQTMMKQALLTINNNAEPVERDTPVKSVPKKIEETELF